MIEKLKEWWEQKQEVRRQRREEKKRKDEEVLRNVVKKLSDSVNLKGNEDEDLTFTSTTDDEPETQDSSCESSQENEGLKAIHDAIDSIWNSANRTYEENPSLQDLISIPRECCHRMLAIDTSDYSRDIPFKAMVKIAELAENLKLHDIYIEAWPTKFFSTNNLKDHIIYGQNSNGIFEVEFESVSSGNDNFSMNEKELTTKVYLSIPIWEGDEYKNKPDAENHLAVITVQAEVNMSYKSETNVNLSDVKDVTLLAAKEVIMRSLNSKFARKLYIPEEIHDLFPTSIDVLKEPYMKNIKVTTNERFSTANKKVDAISDIEDWYE